MAIAELLRSARERRGVTLDRLAEETRIPLGRLAAFEEEGFRPDGFYQRAQIRACARALRLDEKLVLEELRQGATPTVPAMSPEATKPHVAGSRGFSVLMAIGCVVAIAVAAATQLTRESKRVGRPSEAMPASGNPSKPVVNGTEETKSPEIGETTSRTAVGTVMQTEQAAAAPAVSAVSELVITSQPDGARVTVDGVGWGVTPLTIRHLPEGPKRVRLTRDGYAASERVVRVDPERPSRIAVELNRAPSVTSQPHGGVR